MVGILGRITRPDKVALVMRFLIMLTRHAGGAFCLTLCKSPLSIKLLESLEKVALFLANSLFLLVY